MKNEKINDVEPGTSLSFNMFVLIILWFGNKFSSHANVVNVLYYGIGHQIPWFKNWCDISVL